MFYFITPLFIAIQNFVIVFNKQKKIIFLITHFKINNFKIEVDTNGSSILDRARNSFKFK